eukprot:gene21153-27407_t
MSDLIDVSSTDPVSTTCGRVVGVASSLVYAGAVHTLVSIPNYQGSEDNKQDYRSIGQLAVHTFNKQLAHLSSTSFTSDVRYEAINKETDINTGRFIRDYHKRILSKLSNDSENEDN